MFNIITKRIEQSYSITQSIKLGAAIILAIFLTGCATTPENVDPYENFNRKVYKFNTAFDEHIAEPVASAYTKVTPDPVQTGITNFFKNLRNINVVLNDLLQGKFKQGLEDTGRFAINSTVGILGFIDVAKKIGLEQHDEDFGQTLAVWGVGPGPYLVLPFAGPSTLRGTPSFAVEAITNPVLSTFPPLVGLNIVEARARAEGAIKFIDEASLDPYIFTRESFLQWRNFQIHDGDPPIPELYEDLEEELLEEKMIEAEEVDANSEQAQIEAEGEVSNTVLESPTGEISDDIEKPSGFQN